MKYPKETKKKYMLTEILRIDNFRSFISRKYVISNELGTLNNYFDEGEMRDGFYEWDKDFSGEVTYITEIPQLNDGDYILDLGKVSCSATVYIDGNEVGEATFPPYLIKFTGKNKKSVLKIIVANTAANECARTDYFDLKDIRDVGPYHVKMHDHEVAKESGGLFGPVKIYEIEE